MRATALRGFDLMVVGDVNPDLILSGGDLTLAFGQREQLVDQASLVIGGSGSITAAGAARLGLRTMLAGAVGADAFGRFMCAELSAARVDTAHLQVFDSVSTGISVALSHGDDRAVLTFRGAMSAFDPLDVPDAAFAQARHVHIASPFLQPRLRDGLGSLIARAHDAGATVSLDTGWDPDENWASVAAELVHVDVLLPNAQEAVQLASAAGGVATLPTPLPSEVDRLVPVDLLSAASSLAALGPMVVVKLGAAGAVAVTNGQEVVRAAPFAVDAFDATGAGDSFDAGFLAAWLERGAVADALLLACACGALSTRAAGGTGSQATREDAEALLATNGRIGSR